ncbi:MAG TPA: tetratricopeptide repeat protein [Candidatus Methylacidiphilales bacterium]|nr:tetratricopeptide repeat protein [Candidatus Methylacidiphilales bacterium]
MKYFLYEAGPVSIRMTLGTLALFGLTLVPEKALADAATPSTNLSTPAQSTEAPATAAPAPTPEELPPVILRYEQILLKSPGKGASFEKIYQHFLQGPGLQALADRWKAASETRPPNEFAYLLVQGLLAERRGKPADARTAYEQATKLQPTNDRIWAALGDLESSEGRMTEAIAAYKRALELKPPAATRLELYKQLARAKQRNLDELGAVETWRSVVQEYPDDTFALEEAGAAFLASEQFEDANKAYQKLADLSEENSYGRVQAMIKLAEVEERKGKYENALRQYEAALPKTSETSWINRDLRARIEQIYRRQDDLPGLSGYYKKWLEKNPKDVDATLRLANVLQELGHKSEALEALRKATTLAPNRNEVKATLTVRLLEENKADEAVQVATGLTQADASDPHYWELLGEALWKQKQPATPESKAAALAAWGKIAPADTRKPQSVVRLANLLRSHGLHDEGVKEYSRALDLSPDSADTRLAYVDYLMELKKQDEAFRMLAGLVEGNRATAENYVRLANANIKYERQAEASEALNKGLEIDPKNFDLLQIRWNLFIAQQKWTEAIAMFDALTLASPNLYFMEQLEARQVQLLASAKLTQETIDKLRTRFNGTPPLTEGETRLFIRLLETQPSVEDLANTLTEATKRFPQSPSITRLQINYDRKRSDYEACQAGLQRLLIMSPAQKVDLTIEMANVYREQGKLDEALGMAQKLIDASPANTAGYTLYANLALESQKRDLAKAKLKEAIKLAEKPNEIRLQLVRILREDGDLASARALLEEAMESTESADEKLALMRPLTEIYYQSGQVDQLVEKLRQRQRGEEGGWRYGIYLAEVYKQLQDFGAARRELALSLAARPQDATLLKQLLALAEKDGDMEESLRYRRMLVEVDPSLGQQIALATQYANMLRMPEAWQIFEANSVAVAKDPAAWCDVIDAFAGTEYSEKVRDLLSRAGTSGDATSMLAYAEVLITQGDTDTANGILWKVFDQPVPLQAPKPGTSVTVTAQPKKKKWTSSSAYSFTANPFFQRTGNMWQLRQNAQTVMQAANGSRQRRQRSSRTGSMAGQTARDMALMYLSAIAVKDDKVLPMLDTLKEHMSRLGLSATDRLICYTLLQAPTPLWEEMEAIAKSPENNVELQGICYTILTYRYPLDLVTAEPSRKTRAEELKEIYQERIAKLDADAAKSLMYLRVSQQFQSASGDEKEQAKLRVEARKLAAEFDPKDGEEMVSAFQLLSLIGDKEEAMKRLDIVRGLLKQKDASTGTTGGTNAANIQQQMMYAPYYAFAYGKQKKEDAPKFVSLVADCLLLSYPDKEPKLQLTFSQNRYNETFPSPNRFFDETRIGSLQTMCQKLTPIGAIDLLDQALEKQTNDIEGWQKIYPLLSRGYINWWHKDKAKAAELIKEALAIRDSDDIRLSLAQMYTLQERYEDALTQLGEVKARIGPVYISTQQQILRTAKTCANKKTTEKNSESPEKELAKKAALRLAALQLPAEDRNNLIQDLRELGLVEKAEELNKQVARSNSNSNYTAQQQAIAKLNTLVNEKKNEEVAVMARQLLAQDPMAASRNRSYESYARTQAVQALNKTKQLLPYIRDLQKQLDSSPNSQRLNMLMAEALTGLSGGEKKQTGSIPPVWLKLRREGENFISFCSLDGKEWRELERTSMSLPNDIFVGIAVSSNNTKAPVVATFANVSLEGTTSVPEGIANLVSGWQLADIGKAEEVGTLKTLPDNVLQMTSRAGNLGNTTDFCAFGYKKLSGDGELVARVNSMQCGPSAEWAKAALLVRESLEPNSRMIAVCQTMQSTEIMVTKRSTAGEDTARSTYGLLRPPFWLKLERQGSQLSSYASVDGKTWSLMAQFECDLPSECIIGIETMTNPGSDSTESVAKWESIAVTGQSPSTNSNSSPSAAPTLPAPWSLASLAGKEINPATARFDGTTLEVTSGTNKKKEDTELVKSYVFQPLKGDGSIVGRLVSYAGKPGSSAGFSIRTQPKGSANRFALTVDTNGYITSNTSQTGERALQYYRKVAELNPKDIRFQIMLAEKTRNADMKDMAAELYLKCASQNMNAFMENSSVVSFATIRESGRADEFFKLVEGWTPTNANPNLTHYISNFASNLANDNSDDKDLQLAVLLYRKAIKMENQTGYNSGATLRLINTLTRLNNKDEIAKIAEESLFRSKPASQPLLNMQYRSTSIWLEGISYDQSGRMTLTPISTLYMAKSLDFMPSILKRCEEELKKNPNDNDTALLQLFVKILLRDPGCKPLLSSLLREDAKEDESALHKKINIIGSGSYGGHLIMALAQTLVQWPEEKALALELAKAGCSKTLETNNQDFHSKSSALRLQAIIATECGDTELAKESWKTLGTLVKENSASAQYMYGDIYFSVIDALVLSGLYQEADSVLTAVNQSPALANSGYKPYGDLMRNEIQWTLGKKATLSIATRIVRESNGKQTLHWEVNGAGSQGRSDPFYPTSLLRGYRQPLSSQIFDIEIFAGTKPDNLKLLTTLTSVLGVGKQSLDLPAGTKVVQARLLREPKPQKVAGQNLYVFDKPNLLAVNGTSWTSNPGWKDSLNLTGTNISPGPWEGSTTIRFDRQSGRLRAQPIAIEPKKQYVMSCWIHTDSTFRFGVEFAKQNNKPRLQTGSADTPRNGISGWLFVQMLISAEGVEGESMVPFIEPTAFAEIADLSLVPLEP